MTGTLLTTLEVAERLGLSSWADRPGGSSRRPPAHRADERRLPVHRAGSRRLRRATRRGGRLPAAAPRGRLPERMVRRRGPAEPLAEGPDRSAACLGGRQRDPGAGSPAAPIVEAPAVDFRPPAPPPHPPEPAAGRRPRQHPRAHRRREARRRRPTTARTDLGRTGARAGCAGLRARAGGGRAGARARAGRRLSEPEPRAGRGTGAGRGGIGAQRPSRSRHHEPDPATPAAPAQELARPPAGPGPDLSRQAVLVVQPIVRFRVLRDVTDRSGHHPGDRRRPVGAPGGRRRLLPDQLRR